MQQNWNIEFLSQSKIDSNQLNTVCTATENFKANKIYVFKAQQLKRKLLRPTVLIILKASNNRKFKFDDLPNIGE